MPRRPRRPAGPARGITEGGLHEPRSARDLGRDFPYTDRTVCFLEVTGDGVRWTNDAATAYERARAGAIVHAVWPGEWSSHLFVVDDVDELGRALGLLPDADRTGLADHRHEVSWSSSPYDPNPGGTWVTVDLRLDCGCEIRDLKAFAARMREQRGWVVATGGGWSPADAEGGVRRYAVRARRSTLG